jgi:hypothetical protein
LGNSNGCPVASGIAEVAKPVSFSVYPNPSTDIILLKLGEDITDDAGRILIQNSLGEIVRDIPFTKTISVVDLSGGMYTISVTTSGGTFFGKFVKQ